ncbi:hypothetical protein WN51_02121 [Melipona quadrifasciata]|uniref:Uncharacterized protein n=1 Tax=Melipona quadrifasciata TaxID=166423 RepID=A0A0M8ZTM1_9HYME|nr:hypothetical protein WN51_02121 [Melipona quadrifasciata]
MHIIIGTLSNVSVNCCCQCGLGVPRVVEDYSIEMVPVSVFYGGSEENWPRERGRVEKKIWVGAKGSEISLSKEGKLKLGNSQRNEDGSDLLGRSGEILKYKNVQNAQNTSNTNQILPKQSLSNSTFITARNLPFIAPLLLELYCFFALSFRQLTEFSAHFPFRERQSYSFATIRNCSQIWDFCSNIGEILSEQKQARTYTFEGKSQ